MRLRARRLRATYSRRRRGTIARRDSKLIYLTPPTRFFSAKSGRHEADFRVGQIIASFTLRRATAGRLRRYFAASPISLPLFTLDDDAGAAAVDAADDDGLMPLFADFAFIPDAAYMPLRRFHACESKPRGHCTPCAGHVAEPRRSEHILAVIASTMAAARRLHVISDAIIFAAAANETLPRRLGRR